MISQLLPWKCKCCYKGKSSGEFSGKMLPAFIRTERGDEVALGYQYFVVVNHKKVKEKSAHISILTSKEFLP